MNNEVFNLDEALFIKELEERQELSIAAGFEVDQKPDTTYFFRKQPNPDRCCNDDNDYSPCNQ